MTVAADTASQTVPAELLPGQPVDLRRAVRIGAITGLTAMFVSANGMIEKFEVRQIVAGHLTLNMLLLAAIAAGMAYLAASPPPRLEGHAETPPGPRNILAGAIAGLLGGGLLAAFVWVVDAVNVRPILTNVSPELVDILTFGRGVVTGVLLLLVLGAVFGAVGGALHLLPPVWRRAVFGVVLWVFVFALLQTLFVRVFTGARIPAVGSFLYRGAGGLSVHGAIALGAVTAAAYLVSGRQRAPIRDRIAELPERQRRSVYGAGIVVGVAVLAVLPQVLGPFLSEVLNVAGIFLLMALGLNVVVGYAGLLDLGYVAFFAVGAYTSAILTTDAGLYRFDVGLTFFAALPFAMIATAFAGVLVAAPVLRMRGDYLAIVTLGFGEIARLTFLSDWLRPATGGAQGIIRIPTVTLGPLTLQGPQAFFYAIFAFVVLAAYVSWSLRDSRMGRAWMAMREDETVAETMGINTVAAKIYAFVVGATLASFGGALFASKIQSIFPSSFNIIVSITVLVVIIVGGMGSLPGVIVSSLALIGLPELLREFEEFRFLIYGALLIFMMLQRPEGFIPSKVRQRELHHEEALQDAWLDKGAAAEQPDPAGGA